MRGPAIPRGATRSAATVGLAVVFFGLFFGPPLGAQPGETLGQEEVLAALRARAADEGLESEFHVLQQVLPTEETRRIAEVARREDNRGAPLEGGVSEGEFLSAMLAVGGFVVVEYEPATQRIQRLHLVTQVEGNLTLESLDTQGMPELPRVREFARVVEGFVAEVFSPSCGRIYNDIVPGGIAGAAELDPRSFFWLPSNLSQAGSDEEVRALMQPLCGTVLQPLRHALVSETYAANPGQAVAAGEEEAMQALERFLAEKGMNMEDFYAMQDIQGIADREALAHHAAFFRDLEDYLERELPTEPRSAAYQANLTLSSLLWDLWAEEGGGNRLYCANFLPYFSACWEVQPGGFVFRHLKRGW